MLLKLDPQEHPPNVCFKETIVLVCFCAWNSTYVTFFESLGNKYLTDISFDHPNSHYDDHESSGINQVFVLGTPHMSPFWIPW